MRPRPVVIDSRIALRPGLGRWRLTGVGQVLVEPSAIDRTIDRLLAQGGGTGLLPAQALVAEATASGLSAESIDDIIRRLAEAGVEVVSEEPTPEELIGVEPEEMVDPLDEVAATASADLVRVYLREIGRVPLLTGGREVELSKRMERGEYLATKQTQLRDDRNGLPDTDVLGRAIYHAFRGGWPHVAELRHREH